MGTPRYCHAGRQPTRGALTARVQVGRGDVPDPQSIVAGMNNIDNTPGGADDLGSAGTSYPSGRPRKQRMLRWGVGVTLAGFLVGGGIAWGATSSGRPAASTSATTSSGGAGGATGSAL